MNVLKEPLKKVTEGRPPLARGCGKRVEKGVLATANKSYLPESYVESGRRWWRCATEKEGEGDAPAERKIILAQEKYFCPDCNFLKNGEKISPPPVSKFAIP